MAQHDFNIANQSFPSFRTDLNNALSAINTSQSGTSRPSGAVAGTIWLDTTSATTPTLKYYDGADDISLATLDHSANTVNWLDSTVSVTGLTTTATGTVLTLSDTATTSSVNLIIDNDKEIRFREATANGTNYVSLSAPASLSADLTFTLPATDGTAGQFLSTNGSGVLSFATVGGSATPFAVIGNATAGSEIRLPEDTDNGSNYVALKAPDTIASNLTLTLPSADGSSGQVLQTNGSGVLSFSSPSSDFVLLATTDITSSTASASFDGYFSSTYKNYKVIISNLIPVTSNTYLYGRLRRSNADVTTSNYFGVGGYAKACTSNENDNGQLAFVNTAQIFYTTYGLYTTSSYSTVNEVTIYDPLGTTNRKKINWTAGYYSNACGHLGTYNHFGTATLEDNTNALSGLTFYFSSGNIATGNFKLYGIK
jgi:hypothetical protein